MRRGDKMYGMAHKRESLLAQIEAGVLDDSVPVASLLQKCIVLGGKAGSEKMRDWARQELNGYKVDMVPPYRHVHTGLMAIFTNRAGFNGMHQRIVPTMFPQQIRDILAELGVDMETAVLAGGIGELEALAKRDEGEHHLMPPWGDVMVDTLQKHLVTPDTRVKVVYWPLSDASLRGLLVKVRTALAELIAELIASTPESQDVPDKAAADQAVQYVITGERATVHVTSQHAHGSGVNIAVAPSDGVTVSGAGTAIGSQTASGAGSSVVGSQFASGSHNSLTGRDGAAVDPSARQGRWARLRRRGWMVALTTILGGIAGVAAAVLGLFTWLDWTPWWR
ncbi:hypothetical protein I0C86_38415 [Plantactinospora sp. S1510]|uniref:AbiTii domain-containing protein n=2 Tax=Plantactinospora alkalitolerans TaxID=2789879 RepID=A0ABS0H8F4_9ACTN|nr:hypothetical protein [Plantactinospora alkalitolerans]